jgi:hypothetical protein
MEMKEKKLKNGVHKSILLNNLERKAICFNVFERRAKHEIAPLIYLFSFLRIPLSIRHMPFWLNGYENGRFPIFQSATFTISSLVHCYVISFSSFIS